MNNRGGIRCPKCGWKMLAQTYENEPSKIAPGFPLAWAWCRECGYGKEVPPT